MCSVAGSALNLQMLKTPAGVLMGEAGFKALKLGDGEPAWVTAARGAVAVAGNDDNTFLFSGTFH